MIRWTRRLDVLKRHLANVPRVDYVIAHHAEQDHAGSIPYVLEKYPNAIVICSPKAKDLLLTHLDVPEKKSRRSKTAKPSPSAARP